MNGKQQFKLKQTMMKENKNGIKIEGKHHHQLMSFKTFNLSALKLYM